MTPAQGAAFGWEVVAAVLPLLFVVVMVLMGLGLLHWMTR